MLFTRQELTAAQNAGCVTWLEFEVWMIQQEQEKEAYKAVERGLSR